MSRRLTLVLLLIAAAAPLSAAVREVQIHHWIRAPAGVRRELLTQSTVKVEAGRARLRLARELGGLPTHDVEVQWSGLDTPVASVQVVDHRRPEQAGPTLAYGSQAVVRLAPGADGFRVAAVTSEAEPWVSAPEPGTWEVELAPGPRRVSSVWGRQLAVVWPDAAEGGLPPRH